MRKLLFIVMANISVLTTAFAQTGPHTAESPIIAVRLSDDNNKMLTFSYQDIALWDLTTEKVVWTYKTTDFGLAKYDDYFVVTNSSFTYMFLMPKERSEGYVVNLETLKYTPTNDRFNYLSSNGKGAFTKDGHLIVVDLTSGGREDIKWNDNFAYVRDNGTTLYAIANVKNFKYLTYNFVTKKTGTFSFTAKDDPRETGTLQPGAWNAVARTITTPAGTRNMEIGASSSFPEYITKASGMLIFKENKTGPDKKSGKTNYNEYLLFYDGQTGETKRSISLSGSAAALAAVREGYRKAEEQRIAQEKAEREAKLANAKLGFKQFDASFTKLSLPYTINYNAAMGFTLAGDAFFTSDFPLRTGSQPFGMGKICSCNVQTSYLIMTRNQPPSTDLSTFIIITYDIGGNQLGTRTIGATQKDPSGLIKLDFTISGPCFVNVAAKMTYANGNVEDKSFSFGGCRVN